MPRLNMDGPYEHNADIIDLIIEDDSIGNYALGYERGGTFYPKYVGRGNVKERLKAHIGTEYEQDLFKYSYAKNEKEAFIKECKNYHDFKKYLLNKEHPKVPKNETCPYCSDD